MLVLKILPYDFLSDNEAENTQSTLTTEYECPAKLETRYELLRIADSFIPCHTGETCPVLDTGAGIQAIRSKLPFWIPARGPE